MDQETQVEEKSPLMEKQMVADLQKDGAQVGGEFVLEVTDIKPDGFDAWCLDVFLSDASGGIPGFILLTGSIPEEFMKAEDNPQVVRVQGQVVATGIEGRTKIVKFHHLPRFLSPDEIQAVGLERLVPSSGVSEQGLRDAVGIRLGLIENIHIRRMLSAFLADKGRAANYFSMPASLYGPHSQLRGLATHAIETARVVGAAAKSIPGVNTDLVTAGALLYKAGVIEAFRFDGLQYSLSDKGVLFRVNLLSAELVRRLAREAGGIPGQIVDELTALVLNQSETLTPEAVVLGYAVKMSDDVASVIDNGYSPRKLAGSL